MYICITGGTYIHTRNKAGDETRHHGWGDQCEPRSRPRSPSQVRSLLPSSHATGTPNSVVQACWREGGRKACHHDWGKVRDGSQRDGGLSVALVPLIRPSYTRDPCCRKREGSPILSISPPDSSLAPGSFWEGPYSLCQCFEAPGMSREPRRLGLLPGAGGREGGASRHRWGQGLGSAGFPGSWQGWAQGEGLRQSV